MCFPDLGGRDCRLGRLGDPGVSPPPGSGVSLTMGRGQATAYIHSDHTSGEALANALAHAIDDV